MMHDEWLSAVEAARLLGVTRVTARRWLDEGRLDGYRAGRVVRIRASSVERLTAGAAWRPRATKQPA